MSTNFYVYLLLDPRKYYTPFYVGKGKSKRVYESINCTKNKFKNNVIRKIRDTGADIAFTIWRDNLTEQEALELEKELIDRFGRRQHGGILTNLTDGGEGLSGHIFSKEHRIKIGLALKGRIVSAQTKEKMSIKAKGRVASAETKEKMSRGRKGNFCGAKNPMFGRTGIMHPNFGRTGNIGSKNGMFNRPHTEESKKIMSEKARLRVPIKGSASPSSDKTIYKFIDQNHNIFEGTVQQFSEKYNICHHQVGNAKRGSQKTVKGWTVLSL